MPFLRIDTDKLSNTLRWGLLLFCAATWVGLSPLIVPDTNDDAFIFLRYASQLLEGEGAVFNPGERVEGFSSPLWLLLLWLGGVLLRISPFSDSMVHLSQHLSMIAAVAAAALVVFATGARTGDPSPPGPRSPDAVGRHARWWPALGACVLLWSPATIVWGRSGMEATTAGLLLTAATLLTLPPRRVRLAGLAALGGLCWIRPEGPVMAGVILLINGRFPWSWRSRAALVPWLVTLAAAAALLLARLAYYDQWMPNTFHAKMSASWDFWTRGLDYVGGFYAASGGGLLLVLFAAACLHRDTSGLARRALAVLAVYSAVIAIESGDFMWYWRFMAPALPLLVIGAVLGLQAFHAWLPRKLAPLVAGLAALWALVATADLRDRDLIVRAHAAHLKHRRTTSTAKVFRRVFLPGETIAIGPAGQFVYSARPARALDYYGLVVPEIAGRPRRAGQRVGHERWHLPSILHRKPEFLLLSLGWRLTLPCAYLGSGDRLRLPADFGELNTISGYRLAFIRHPKKNYSVTFLIRLDALGRRRDYPVHPLEGACPARDR